MVPVHRKWVWCHIEMERSPSVEEREQEQWDAPGSPKASAGQGHKKCWSCEILEFIWYVVFVVLFVCFPPMVGAVWHQFMAPFYVQTTLKVSSTYFLFVDRLTGFDAQICSLIVSLQLTSFGRQVYVRAIIGRSLAQHSLCICEL